MPPPIQRPRKAFLFWSFSCSVLFLGGCNPTDITIELSGDCVLLCGILKKVVKFAFNARKFDS